MLRVFPIVGLALGLAIIPVPSAIAGTDEVFVDIPEIILAGVPFSMQITAPDSVHVSCVGGEWAGGEDPAFADASLLLVPTTGQVRLVDVRVTGSVSEIGVVCAGVRSDWPLRVLPGWLSLLPPLLAIGLALATRQVIVSLLLGVFSGTLILYRWNPFEAFMHLGDRFLVGAVADSDHASVVLFTTILGGMVGVLSRTGATEGIVLKLRQFVRGRRGGQVATAMMGTAIFFDDYANTLLVGNTMRPLTDRLRISREKLAYIVDSTAAPVATIAVISTWVGFEVGLIQDAMAHLGGGAPYTFFLRTIPYGFYPILTLVFVYLIAVTGRDFGPMLVAERRATKDGLVLRPGARPAADTLEAHVAGEPVEPLRPAAGGVPILLVIVATVMGLWWDGRVKLLATGVDEYSLREILNHADSFSVLIWAATVGAVAAVVVAVWSRRLSLIDAVGSWVDGAKAMLIAIVILILAWALSATCAALQTAPYLVEICRGVLSAHLLPMVTFILAGVVSFATGTSWGTMAILMPLVFPLGQVLPLAEGISAATATSIHLGATGAVLAGAVFGDHCSPISDTTILSSLATGSDHVDHVRTQLPYAGTVAAIAVLTGYLPAGFGVSPCFSLAAGVVCVLAVIRWRARAVTNISSTGSGARHGVD